MATRAILTVGQIVRAGLAKQAGTVGVIPDGHKFANDGQTYVRITKTTSSGDVTFRTPKKVIGLDLEELVVTFQTDDVKLIGPFPTNVFNQPDGYVYVDYESGEEAEFTIEVYRI